MPIQRPSAGKVKNSPAFMHGDAPSGRDAAMGSHGTEEWGFDEGPFDMSTYSGTSPSIAIILGCRAKATRRQETTGGKGRQLYCPTKRPRRGTCGRDPHTPKYFQEPLAGFRTLQKASDRRKRGKAGWDILTSNEGLLGALQTQQTSLKQPRSPPVPTLYHSLQLGSSWCSLGCVLRT